MNKRPSPLLWVSCLLLLNLAGCKSDQSSDVFQKHLDQYPDIRKKYLYQSVIRLANIKQDPGFNKLIRDVDKITIYFPPSEDSTYQIKSLMTEMRSKNYEELASFRSQSGEKVSLWVNDTKGKPHYVGLLDTPTSDYFFEIDGELDLEYISSLNVADGKSLMNLLN